MKSNVFSQELNVQKTNNWFSHGFYVHFNYICLPLIRQLTNVKTVKEAYYCTLGHIYLKAVLKILNLQYKNILFSRKTRKVFKTEDYTTQLEIWSFPSNRTRRSQ